MSKLTFVVVALSLAACGGKKQSAGSAEAISKLSEFKTKACGCKDEACVATVMADYMKWTEGFMSSKKADDKMSADDEKQIDKLNADTKACIDKFEHAAGAEPKGSADPTPAPADHPATGDKHSEAMLQLNKIGKNSKTMFITNAVFVKGKAASLPAADCCKTAGKCAPEKEAFAKDPVWQGLDFEIDEPNQFHYTYESADGTTFHAEASGDPDCSGKTVTYKLDGKAEGGNPSFTITEP